MTSYEENRAIRAEAVIAATSLLNPAIGIDVIRDENGDGVYASRHLRELTSQIGTYIKHGVWADPDDE